MQVVVCQVTSLEKVLVSLSFSTVKLSQFIVLFGQTISDTCQLSNVWNDYDYRLTQDQRFLNTL